MKFKLEHIFFPQKKDTLYISSHKVARNIFAPSVNKCENYVSPYLFSDTFYYLYLDRAHEQLQITFSIYYIKARLQKPAGQVVSKILGTYIFLAYWVPAGQSM